MSTPKGKLNIASKILNDMRSHAKDDEEKKKIEHKILEITIQYDLLDLNEAYAQFLRTTGTFAVEKKKSFALFLHSINSKGIDLLGRKLVLDSAGKITIEGK